jgi:GcrA cell cycle regulator
VNIQVGNVLPAGPRRRNPDWTDEAVERLKALWRGGKTSSQIAQLLGNGVTRNAVIGKVHRLHLGARATSTRPPQPPRLAADEQVMKRVQREFSDAERVHNAALRAERKNERRRERRAAGRQASGAKIAELEQQFLANCTPITILDLTNSTCRWPIGDPADLDTFRYCGTAKSPDLGSYCPLHAALAYQPRQVRRHVRPAYR